MIVVSLISEVFYPVLPGGFAQFFRYGPGLRERGVQLRVHTTLQPEHGDERELVVNGIEIQRHGLPEGIDVHRERTQLIRRALVRMERDGREVSHCLQPSGNSWQSSALLWRSRIQGIASTFYFTMFPDGPLGGGDQRIRHALRIRAEQAPYAKLIVCSRRMKVAYEQIAGRRTDRMVVLPNGVDLERFAPPAARAEYRRKLGLPEGVPLVLFCGSVTPRKGVDVLLDAWDRVSEALPQAVLVILGSVGMRPTFRGTAMRTQLEEFTREIEGRLADDPTVILPGEVEGVEDYYRAADLFVFPSRREGLPNAVLEAMASGLPCVIAPFAGIPDDGEEFGFHGKHFVRSSHDPERMAADVLELLVSTGKGAVMGKAAREWMEATQQPEQTLDLLAGFYRSAVGSD